MRGRTKLARLKRLLLCLGLGAVAPLGSIKVGSPLAALVVALCLAGILWIVGDMLDQPDDASPS